MIKKVHIYDCDGVLVDSTHRYRIIPETGKIDLAHWRENEYKAGEDSLLPLAEGQYRADLENPEVYVIIATARELRNPDWLFFKERLGMPDYIIHRPHGSPIGGGLLKIKGLQKFANLKQFKTAQWVFFEDNTSYLKQVVDFFRKKVKIHGVYIPSEQGH